SQMARAKARGEESNEMRIERKAKGFPKVPRRRKGNTVSSRPWTCPSFHGK
ncbi:unnamed protein product, partial [Cladocopium goreaui]